MNHESDISVVPEIPEAFTVRNIRRDFVEWHLGRPAYVLWTLDFDTAAVMPRILAAQAQLADLLLNGYSRQPHITLSLCGFPSDIPIHADDFGPDLIRAQVQAMQQLRLARFEIEIGGLETFTSVPYFTVHEASGQLAALHACLAAGCAQAVSDNYVPHMTVGLYADAWPLSAVQARLRNCVLPEPVRLLVHGVSLMSYQSADIGGVLTFQASYAFDGYRQR